jgi:hypothetical protein
MSQIEPEFAPYDAWILLAILYNHERGPSSLQDILATADAINHAIPTRDELNNALNRLLAAGYVVEHGGNFDATDAARAEYSKVKEPRTPMLDELERIKTLLVNHAPLASVPRRVNISVSSLEAACGAYKEALWEQYRRL